MLLQSIWDWLEGEVFNLPGMTCGSNPSFNPYLGVDPSVDRPGADRLRRENLRRYLESFAAWPETLVIGEAPGWRGCRFSGVPFTSEAQLNGMLPFGGVPSSLRKQPLPEAAATIFWREMQEYHPHFFIWNSMPLHPHLPGKPLSNRKPTSKEIRTVETALMDLVSLLKPDQLIAVGKSAQTALGNLGLEVIAVRHPGHGGAKLFQAKIREVFNGERIQPDCLS